MASFTSSQVIAAGATSATIFGTFEEPYRVDVTPGWMTDWFPSAQSGTEFTIVFAFPPAVDSLLRYTVFTETVDIGGGPGTADDLCNQALLLLGAKPMLGTLASPDPTSDRDLFCATFYPQTRDATVESGEWNEATRRAGLLAYRTPAYTLTPGAVSGTGVTFTASGPAFDDTGPDVGRTIRLATGRGKATITAVALGGATCTVTITESFESLDPIAAAAWRVYYTVPAWGLTFSLPVPAETLRIFHVQHSRGSYPAFDGPAPHGELPAIRYRHEGAWLAANVETLHVLYVFRLVSVAAMSARLKEAIVYHLAAKLAEPVTGNQTKANSMWQLYGRKLTLGQGLDLTEGSRERKEQNRLVDVRR